MSPVAICISYSCSVVSSAWPWVRGGGQHGAALSPGTVPARYCPCPRPVRVFFLMTGEVNHGILAERGCNSDPNCLLRPKFIANKMPQCPLINMRYLVPAQLDRVRTNFGEAHGFWNFRATSDFPSSHPYNFKIFNGK